MWGWALSGFDAEREGSTGQARWLAGWACCAIVVRKKGNTGIFHAACRTILHQGIASFVGGRGEANLPEDGAGDIFTHPTGPSGESLVCEVGACLTEPSAFCELHSCAVVGGCAFSVDLTACGGSCWGGILCVAVELLRTAAWGQREGITEVQGGHCGGWGEFRRACLMSQPWHPLKQSVVT